MSYWKCDPHCNVIPIAKWSSFTLHDCCSPVAEYFASLTPNFYSIRAVCFLLRVWIDFVKRQHAPNKLCVLNNDVRLITRFYDMILHTYSWLSIVKPMPQSDYCCLSTIFHLPSSLFIVTLTVFFCLLTIHFCTQGPLCCSSYSVVDFTFTHSLLFSSEKT